MYSFMCINYLIIRIPLMTVSVFIFLLFFNLNTLDNTREVNWTNSSRIVESLSLLLRRTKKVLVTKKEIKFNHLAIAILVSIKCTSTTSFNHALGICYKTKYQRIFKKKNEKKK